MGPNRWNDLGNGYEAKWVKKGDGEGTLMFRRAGQQSEYPHSTVFFRRTADGRVEFFDEHNSLIKGQADHRVTKNLGFFLQSAAAAELDRRKEDLRKVLREAHQVVHERFNQTEDFDNGQAFLDYLHWYYDGQYTFGIQSLEVEDQGTRKVCRFSLWVRRHVEQ